MESVTAALKLADVSVTAESFSRSDVSKLCTGVVTVTLVSNSKVDRPSGWPVPRMFSTLKQEEAEYLEEKIDLDYVETFHPVLYHQKQS